MPVLPRTPMRYRCAGVAAAGVVGANRRDLCGEPAMAGSISKENLKKMYTGNILIHMICTWRRKHDDTLPRTFAEARPWMGKSASAHCAAPAARLCLLRLSLSPAQAHGLKPLARSDMLSMKASWSGGLLIACVSHSVPVVS